MTAGWTASDQARAEHVAREAIAEIILDRQPGLASDRPPSEAVYAAVAGELRALVFQVAEMAEHESHNLIVAAEYLHGLLGREPLRSGPTWAPQRVVLGLFLMGLTNALERVEVITAQERDALRPAYQEAAVAEVTGAFDVTFIPPSDPSEPEPEGDPMPPQPDAPPTDEDDDPARFL